MRDTRQRARLRRNDQMGELPNMSQEAGGVLGCPKPHVRRDTLKTQNEIAHRKTVTTTARGSGWKYQLVCSDRLSIGLPSWMKTIERGKEADPHNVAENDASCEDTKFIQMLTLRRKKDLPS